MLTVVVNARQGLEKGCSTRANSKIVVGCHVYDTTLQGNRDGTRDLSFSTPGSRFLERTGRRFKPARRSTTILLSCSHVSYHGLVFILSYKVIIHYFPICTVVRFPSDSSLNSRDLDLQNS